MTLNLRYSLDQNPPCHSDERWVGVTRGDVELPKWESRMADKEREPLLSGPKMEDSGSESNQHEGSKTLFCFEGRTGSREVKRKESPRSSLHMAAIQKDNSVALAGVFKKKKK